MLLFALADVCLSLLSSHLFFNETVAQTGCERYHQLIFLRFLLSLLILLLLLFLLFHLSLLFHRFLPFLLSLFPPFFSIISQGMEHVDILPALIESLAACHFLTDHLAMPHSSKGREDMHHSKGRGGGGGGGGGEDDDGIDVTTANSATTNSAQKRFKGGGGWRGGGGAGSGENSSNNSERYLEKKLSNDLADADDLHSGR